MKIILSVGIGAVEALGSVTRMLAVAKCIEAMEPTVEILFRAEGEEAERIEEMGYKTIGGYKPQMLGWAEWKWNLIKSIPRKDMDFDVPSFVSMEDVVKLKGMYTKKFVQATYSEWIELIERFDPDVICGEFDLVAPIVCEEKKIPYVHTLQTPMLQSFKSILFKTESNPNKKYYKHYNKLLKKQGLKQLNSVLDLFYGYGKATKIVPNIPEMEELPRDKDIHYLGMLVPETSTSMVLDWEKSKKIIYVYLGTSQVKGKEIIKELKEAYSNSNYDVFISCAGNPYLLELVKEKGDTSGILIDGNLRFYPYLPSMEVLNMADLAIHHGGHNTTMQCIEARVPALIVPCNHYERYFNAIKAKEIGCAEILNHDEFKGNILKEKTDIIIKGGIKQESLAKISKKIKEMDGPRNAAKLILNLVK